VGFTERSRDSPLLPQPLQLPLQRLRRVPLRDEPSKKGEGRYQGQMAVYVKPRGGFGAAYMALIRPFRHRVVYPALMRRIERAWNARLARRPE
jgi:hypothetical protein